jgi:hypothetical protein
MDRARAAAKHIVLPEHVQLGAAIYSTAITYAIDGKQYVAIAVGSALFAFAIDQP